MFDRSYNQMNKWRWDNPSDFGDQADCYNPQSTSPGMVKCKGKHFSQYGRDVLKEILEPPRCNQYNPSDFLVVIPQNWDEIMDKHNDDLNWADPRALNGGRSCPRDGSNNYNSKSAEDMQGSEKRCGQSN